ncbi:MAG: hypothetical protein D6772_12910 [Bacteroidetes bacterium]|nr:MAG: hypothetical protein D6772_12910 [Bacteroidota bacterium]
MKPFFYLLALLILLACEAEPGLRELEAAYAANPQAETLAALEAAYSEALAAPDLSAAERQSLLVRQGVLFIKQDNYAALGQTLTNAIQDDDAPRGEFFILLDSLLANMTDPSEGRLKPQAALQYIAAVSNFAQRYPAAPQSPELLYKGAEIARSIGALQRALDMYEQIETKFPNYERASTALFMRAFTYGENLQNEEEARRLYQLFLEKYPDDDFADDAAMLLQTLGKSDEEIFQELIKEKN